MRTSWLVVLALAVGALTRDAEGQWRVRPVLSVGLTQFRSVQHGYQDVSQYGWIGTWGGAVGLTVRGPARVGVETTVEHQRGRNTAIYDVNFLPTGEEQPIARVTTLSVLATVAPSRWLTARAGPVFSRQRGDFALGEREARVGVRVGAVVGPSSLRSLRPGLDLSVTRFLAGTAGANWAVGTGVVVRF